MSNSVLERVVPMLKYLLDIIDISVLDITHTYTND